MRPVITAEQARKITGGRAPLVPVEYETAVKALQECSHLDETKYWSDKADALAAWAKIYRSDQAEREARALKLHAYRRMGQLAAELRPTKLKKTVQTEGSVTKHRWAGREPGPKSLLREQGLKSSHVSAAGKLGRMPETDFRRLVESPKPPAINTIAAVRLSGSESWRLFQGMGGSSPIVFRGFCRRHKAQELAKGLTLEEVPKARELITEIIEWLDEFEQCLGRRSAQGKKE